MPGRRSLRKANPGDARVDVLIIGCGAAGQAAAIEASRRGAAVKVLDEAPTWGGTAMISGGGCFLVDTPLQRRLGIADSPDLALEDWYTNSNGTADMEWAEFYVRRSNPDVYQWLADLGVVWLDVTEHEGRTVPRWHRPKGGGAAIAKALHSAAEASGVDDWVFSTTVEALEKGAAGNVVGARVAGNRHEAVSARAVIVATGGFCSNHPMVLKHSRLRRTRVLVGGGPHALGKGHGLLAAAGAELISMGDLVIYPYGTPDPRDKKGTRGIVVRHIDGSVWVNAQSARFHNERLSGSVEGTFALLAQVPPAAWAIIDSSMTEGMEVADPYYRTGDEAIPERVRELLERSPHVRHASTVEGLASGAGLNGRKLKALIERYNGYFERDPPLDPEFGKRLAGLGKIETPPFYAIRFFPLARKNLGGVRTDLGCRVLDKRGVAIPGLYAAGEVAGMAGGHINGEAAFEGTMLGPSIFSGRVAGATAAHDLGFGEAF